MKKTLISSAVSNAISAQVPNSSGLSFDSSGDQAALASNQEGWDDLNVLKDDLATNLLQLVFNTEYFAHHPGVQEKLGERRREFDRLIEVFRADVRQFTETFEELKDRHKNFVGAITSMEQLNEFTSLSMRYQVLAIEMYTLMAPTMTSIVMLVHEVMPDAIVTAPNNAAAAPALETPNA